MPNLLCFEEGIVSAYADRKLVGVLAFELVADRTAVVVDYSVDEAADPDATEASLLGAVTGALGLNLIEEAPEPCPSV